MLYFYSARNGENQLVRGTIEAISAQAAREALKEMDLVAEELHEATLHEKRATSEGTINLPSAHSTPNLVLEGDVDIAPPPPAPPVESRPSTKEEEPSAPKKRSPKKKYHPFTDTLRLYAGWLLAWYCLVYALGAYQHTRNLSFRVPYVEALLPPYSPIVLTFTLAAFLFLFGTSLHRAMGGGRIKGLAVTAVCIASFVFYRLNV